MKDLKTIIIGIIIGVAVPMILSIGQHSLPDVNNQNNISIYKEFQTSIMILIALVILLIALHEGLPNV